MSSATSDYFDLDSVGGVTVVEVTTDVIRHPAQAQGFSEDLAALVEHGARSIVVNLKHTHYLGSSAFAALFGLARRLDAVGGKLAICGLHPEVQTGANILGLGTVASIFETEKEALASF